MCLCPADRLISVSLCPSSLLCWDLLATLNTQSASEALSLACSRFPHCSLLCVGQALWCLCVFAVLAGQEGERRLLRAFPISANIPSLMPKFCFGGIWALSRSHRSSHCPSSLHHLFFAARPGEILDVGSDPVPQPKGRAPLKGSSGPGENPSSHSGAPSCNFSAELQPGQTGSPLATTLFFLINCLLPMPGLLLETPRLAEVWCPATILSGDRRCGHQLFFLRLSVATT